ncbi:MAG: hypothetical protein P8P84_21685 [Paracoccaceae bacterium]|nr:hypothetical protein [Paracoccaceae bacterium]
MPSLTDHHQQFPILSDCALLFPEPRAVLLAVSLTGVGWHNLTEDNYLEKKAAYEARKADKAA